MESYSPESLLASLTSGLRPATAGSKEQVENLKQRLATLLQTQHVNELLPTGLSRMDKLKLQPVLTGSEAFDAGEPSQEITSKRPTETTATDSSSFRVFRRETPVKTSQYEASVPKWAAGQAVAETAGPFLDDFGKWYWFDFYKKVQYISVLRGSDVFLQIPVTGFLFAQQQYRLPAGSVWLRSQLLAPSAPAGAYSGLKIKGGTITFTNPVTISGNSIILDSTGHCELSLELDQPVVNPAIDSTTGDDAKNANPQLPLSVRLTFHPGFASITEVPDMTLELYGSHYTFSKGGAAPFFEPVLNRILIPFESNTDVCTVAVVRSSLFNVSGPAAIMHTSWALPVTVAPVSQLGEAAGTGAIAIKVRPALTANWNGLEKGPVKLNEAYLMSEPGRVAITATQASSRNGRQKFELWEEKNKARKVRSTAALEYAKPFTLLYNSASDGSEVLLIKNAGLQCSIDQPLTADKKRLNIQAPACDAMLAEIKSKRFVFLQAKDMMQQRINAKKTEGLAPVSFALSNALIKTTPVDDFFLIGKWTGLKEINEGTVVLNCPIYFLLPSLPDPYVTTFNPLKAVGRTALTYAAQTAVSGRQSGMSLTTIVKWPDPATPALQLVFVPDQTQANVFFEIEKEAAGSETKQAANFFKTPYNESTNTQVSAAEQPVMARVFNRIKINQTAEVQAEDEANTAGLRALFNRSLNVAGEQIYLLDVSTNADLFGVGLSVRRGERKIANVNFPFTVEGIDLVTYAFNTRAYTLPQIQWEPLWTIQNPDVSPYPFPSPATSANTGDPTLIGTTSFKLVPVAPKPVLEKMLSEYNDLAAPQKLGLLFSLPFGMKSVALLDNAIDATKPGAAVSYNQPEFEKQKLKGGLQITVMATSPDSGPDAESPGFKGATIQTRNLIELLTGTIPLDDEGKPLSVLGPVVDTIFNGEFKSSGANPRVPLERMDVSGYGATIFSNWLNPTAQIAATSQAKFDVLIGRTSHEIIQVKSILYPWGVAVVRTITIQRTSGGGVTRYDTGWKAQGPGLYDFSYTDTAKIKHPNPYEFHPGVVKGMYNVTHIRDTGRMYRKVAADPLDSVIMQEVFFNGDVLIEDVATGAFNGFVPSKKQRGFVQLAPYQKPLTPQQFYDLLNEEGALGGPVDCIVNVGLSGQPMRVVLVDVHGADDAASKIFVPTAHGSLELPKEGAWSMVMRKQSSQDMVILNENASLPLVREGKLGTVPTQPYRFADPADLKAATAPQSDYGILHSVDTQKILFLRPTIQKNDPNIKSTFSPYFADSFAIIGSKGIFPALDATFPIGTGGTNLKIKGAGKLELTSGGTYKAPAGVTRDMVLNGDSRIYINYSDAAGAGDTAEVSYFFDSDAAVPWFAKTKNHSLVVDLLGFNSLITVSTEFDAAYGQQPRMPKPKTKFGSILQPIVDMLSFLGGQDISQALAVSMSNTNTTSWQPKLQGILDMELEFKTFIPPKLPEFEVKVAHTNLKGEPPIPAEPPEAEPLPVLILGCEIALKAYFNMRPQSLTITDASGTPATPEELEAASVDMISSGATLEIEGEIHILFYTITPNVAGIYFVGILGFEFGLDSKEGKSFGFKVAMGLEIRAQWPIVGEVAVMMAIGLEMEWSDAGSGVFAIFIFKGEAELLGGIIVIGIAIEAKGGQEKEITDGVTETFAVCEVEFAAEVSLAFVIHIEFSETWQERKQVS